MIKLTCPECQGNLIKTPDLAEGVWECESCRSRWAIIKTSDGDKRKAQQLPSPT